MSAPTTPRVDPTELAGKRAARGAIGFVGGLPGAYRDVMARDAIPIWPQVLLP